MKKTLRLYFLLLIFSMAAHAQTAVNSIGITPFVGLKMFTADSTLKGSTWGIEGVYHINMANNQAEWVKMLNVRSVDLALSYRNYQNVYLSHQPKTSTGFLGDYYGALVKVGFMIANAGKTELILDPGFGLGYATQTYYTNNNPLVGSHINFTAQIGLKVVTPLTASTRLFAGADLYHYSNAAFKLPNYGVNSINASIGIDHDISSAAPSTSKNEFHNYKKHTFELGVSIGRRGLVQDGGGLNAYNVDYQKNATSKLYQSGLYAGYNYRLNPVLSFRAGIDAVYYFTPLDTISDIKHYYATYQELGSSYDRFKVGASLGTELWLGRVSLPLNIGYNLHYHYFKPTLNHNYQPPDFYWTFGARYYFTQMLAIEAKQYLYRTQAHFAAFGLVVKI